MPYIGKPQSADAFRVTPSNIDSALKGAVSGSNDSEMTLATASIAAITASISRIDSEIDTNAANITLATASIAAITASLGQPVNTNSNVTFNNITSTGTLTAVEVHTTFVSSSIAVASGSNNFGDATDDHHSFTGSLSVSGSGTITGSLTVEGSSTIDDLTATSITATGDISGSTTGSFGHIRIGTGGNIDLSSDDVIIRNLVSNKDLIFKGNDGGTEVETMRINYSGNNIGIGTNSPGGKLHVDDDRSTAYNGAAEIAETVLFRNKNGSDGSGVNNVTSIGLQVGDGATSQGFLNYVRTGDNNGKFTFSQRTAGSTYVESMTISGSNVGIGDTAPTSDSGFGTPIVRIKGSTHPAFVIRNTSSGGEGLMSCGDEVGLQFAMAGNATAAHNVIKFRTGNTNNNYNSTERMRITSAGNVAIGTTDQITSFGSGRTTLTIAAIAAGGSNNYAVLELEGKSATNDGILGTINFYDTGNQNCIIQAQRATSTTSAGLEFYTRVHGQSIDKNMELLPIGGLELKNETLNPDGASFTGLFVSTIKTAGSSDTGDTFFGYRNHLEWADADQGWGSMYGWFNNTQVSAGAGESNQILGAYNSVSWEAADVDNIFGQYTQVVCEGGTVDTNVFGQQTFVNIDSGVTLSNAVYGQQIKIDGDVNPADAYYGLQISQQGGQMHGSDDFFFFCFDDQNDDIVAQITALAGVATFDSGDFNGAPDYAEYFETKDGNKIAPGTTVKLDGDKVVPCEDGDTPIGVARPDGTSAIVGNAKTLGYQGKYLTTDYDEIIMEDYKLVQWVEEINLATYRANRQDTKPVLGGNVRYYMEEGTDREVTTKYFRKHSYHSDRLPSGVTVPVDATTQTPLHQRKKLNPDYDPSKADDYKGRATRDEWCLVGLLGQIPITKGQPLASNWIKMKDVSDTVEMYFVK